MRRMGWAGLNLTRWYVELLDGRKVYMGMHYDVA